MDTSHHHTEFTLGFVFTGLLWVQTPPLSQSAPWSQCGELRCYRGPAGNEAAGGWGGGGICMSYTTLGVVRTVVNPV